MRHLRPFEPVKPEWMRKAAMNRYADIQIIKLKVVIVLGIINILVRLPW